MSSERDSPIYFKTKPVTFWIPIGLKGKIWFGNILDIPFHTTSGFLLVDKIRFGLVIYWAVSLA